MRHTLLLGLVLTTGSLLSLISYHAGTSAPAGQRGGYTLAITTGSGLRLAAPSGPAGGGLVADQRSAEAGKMRTLSCASVVQLGILDVGYDCEAQSVQAGL